MIKIIIRFAFACFLLFHGVFADAAIQRWYYFFQIDLNSPPQQRTVKLTPQELCTPEVIYPRYTSPAYVVGMDFSASPAGCTVKWNFYPPFNGADRTSYYAITAGVNNINDTRAGMTGDFGIRDLSCPVGNPIMPGSGVKRHDELDFSSANQQYISLARVYRSSYLLAPQDGFGGLWMHQYQRRLDLQLRDTWYPMISALRQNGEIVRFTAVSGTWLAMDGQPDSIVPVLDANRTIQGWQYKDAHESSVENYDSAGKLISVQERNGWTTTLVYSDSTTPRTIAPRANLLIRITSRFGRSIQFTYDANGRIATMVSPDQKTSQYAYNTNGMLASVTWPDGKSRTYHYEDSRFPWALTGITDEAGVRFASYSYDEQGRSVGTEHAGGADKVQLQFLGQRQTVVTSADGSSRNLAFELVNNVLRPTTASASCPECGNVAQRTAYDASGNVSSRTDFNNRETRYTYDTLGRETQRIEGYGASDAKTTTTQWHPTWRLPVKVAAPGRVDYFSYDDKGQLIGYAWFATSDANGSQGVNAQPVGAVTSSGWNYDANGLVTAAVDRVDDSVTGQWSFTYDGQGNLMTVTNGAGQTGTAVQYDGAGRLLEAVDVNGSRIKYAYSPRGWLTDANIDGQNIHYDYDAIGQRTAITGPQGFITQYTYDLAHRLIQILDNITIPQADMQGSTISPFGSDAVSANAAASSVVQGASSTWNALVAWLKDWLSGLIKSAQAQGIPFPNSYVPPLRPGPGQAWNPISSTPASTLDPNLAAEEVSPGLHVLRFLTKLQQACGDVVDVVVKKFDKSTPPGDCDEDEYSKLRSQVDQNCKTGQAYCRVGENADILSAKKAALQQCANSRRRIMNICFRGGDDNHQREWVKVLQQVEVCNGL
ncbi:DUF6531 domain-containing protein [Cupriavidus malaysiensis]|uniref:DUF6531 domain-containing protein n=1 Tax=Cupriavidus malaysiensis TaxID=367825 RepID=UPI000A041776|nr:DUF6531 domain-containing protein [Cupriavidus malaysiensis]